MSKIKYRRELKDDREELYRAIQERDTRIADLEAQLAAARSMIAAVIDDKPFNYTWPGF